MQTQKPALAAFLLLFHFAAPSQNTRIGKDNPTKKLSVGSIAVDHNNTFHLMPEARD